MAAAGASAARAIAIGASSDECGIRARLEELAGLPSEALVWATEDLALQRVRLARQNPEALLADAERSLRSICAERRLSHAPNSTVPAAPSEISRPGPPIPMVAAAEAAEQQRASSDPHPDWAALVRLFMSTNGSEWYKPWNITDSARVCNWTGVVCDGAGRVSSLTLPENNLAGSLPAELAGLEGLKFLNLASNALTGQLADYSLLNMTGLEVLDLGNNDVSGSMPTSFPGFPALRFLFLTLNNISGTLPSDFSGLHNLTLLELDGNFVEGEIPSVWSGLPKLVKLNLHGNRLSGSLPSRFSGLPSLTSLSLSGNELGGTISGQILQGLVALSSLFLYDNRLSGTLPSNLSSLPVLRDLYVYDNYISGEFPAVWYGAENLHTISAGQNMLSGTVPSAVTGLPSLKRLLLADNAIGGELPAGWDNFSQLRKVDLHANLLSGTISAALFTNLDLLNLAENADLGGTLEDLQDVHVATMADLQIQFCKLSGTLPPAIFAAQNLSVLNLEGNQLTDLQSMANISAGLSLGKITAFRVGQNRFSGALPDAVCQLVNSSVPNVLDLSYNQFTSVPSCLGALPNLVTLDVSHNLLSELPAGGLLGPTSGVVELRLDWNTLSADSLRALGSSARLQNIILDGNPLNSNAVAALQNLTTWFPSLVSLSASDCNLESTELVSFRGIQVLDLSLNPGIEWQGYDFASQSFSGPTPQNESISVPLDLSLMFPSLKTLDISSTGVTSPYSRGIPPFLSSFSAANVSGASDCLPHSLLRSRHLRSLNITGVGASLTAERTGRGLACLRHIRNLVHPLKNARRYFPQSALSCPVWVTNAGFAQIAADAPFLAYEECLCASGSFWLWDDDRQQTGSCRECPFDGIVCDPYVRFPVPCMKASSNYYPVAVISSASGQQQQQLVQVALPTLQADLARSTFLKCRRPGLCNVSPPPCRLNVTEPTDGSGSHTVLTEDNRWRQMANLSFACDAGHDNSTLLCSRCLPGHWMSTTGLCRPCGPFGQASVLLPVGFFAVTLAAVVWYFGYGRRETDAGWRTFTIALLWFQLQGLVRGPVLFYLGSGQAAWHSLMTRIYEFGRTVLLLEPGVLVCLTDEKRPDFALESALVLASPLAVVLLATTARLLLAPVARRCCPGTDRPHLRTRLAALVLQTLQVLFVPVTSRALQLFTCESHDVYGGSDQALEVSFVSAAPYMSCDDGRLVSLRAAAGVVLTLFSLPLPVFWFWLVRRRVLRLFEAWRFTGLFVRASSRDARLRDLVLAGRPAGDADTGRPRPTGAPAVELHARRSAPAAGDYGMLERQDTVPLERDTWLPDGSGRRRRRFPTDLLNPVDLVFLTSLGHPDTKWWWPVLFELGLKLLLVLLVGLVPITSPALAAGVALLSLVAFQLHFAYRPWKHWVDNTLESLVLGTITGTYLGVVGILSMDGGVPSRSATSVAVYVDAVVEALALVVLALAACFRKKLEERFFLETRPKRAQALAGPERPQHALAPGAPDRTTSGLGANASAAAAAAGGTRDDAFHYRPLVDPVDGDDFDGVHRVWMSVPTGTSAGARGMGVPPPAPHHDMGRFMEDSGSASGSSDYSDDEDRGSGEF